MDKPTVLVVDDDPLVRGIIRDVLQSDGVFRFRRSFQQ